MVAALPTATLLDSWFGRGMGALVERLADYSTPELCLTAIARHADRQAFSELFRKFAPSIARYFGGVGVPSSQVDDLVQDVMLTVWRKAGLYDPRRASAATWIFAIARNRRIDALRRERRPEVELSEQLFADLPHPDANIDRAREAVVLRSVLDDLPPEQANVLQRAYFDDRSLSQIAEESNVPLGTVKSRVRLALQRLRAALGPGSGS